MDMSVNIYTNRGWKYEDLLCFKRAIGANEYYIGQSESQQILRASAYGTKQKE